MGTRNIIAVKSDNIFKVIKYCQWDGYPSGQGKDLLLILKKIELSTLKEKIDEVSDITEKQFDNIWEKIIKNPLNKDTISQEESDEFNKLYPQLSRDMGAEIINYIMNNKEVLLSNSWSTGMSNSWCEWYYVIDLDENKLNIHKKPIFKDLKKEDYKKEKLSYIKESIIKTYDLNNLPTVQTFLIDLESE